MIAPRASVARLRPYPPSPDGRRAFIRLDLNENTEGLPAEAGVDAVAELYPEYGALTAGMAALFNLSPEQVLPTNGSDEALFLAAFTFIEPGRGRALCSKPTFAMIPHYLTLVGAEVTEVPVKNDLSFDLEAIESALAGGMDLVMFPSPDNPTGALLDPDRVRRWCRQWPETLFLIDEAYEEYVGQTVLPLLEHCPNLLVTRTFSKAWSMAGLRLGCALGDPRLLQWMSVTRSPFSVNAAAARAALAMLPRSAEVTARAQALMRRRAELAEHFRAQGCRVGVGHGNFFLLGMGADAPAFARFCRERRILIKDRSGDPFTPGMIRVTVGTEEENAVLRAALDDFRRTHALIFDLDDTLVDTSVSYDRAVAELVERHSGWPLTQAELRALKAEGGFNDDWISARELLRRRGFALPLADLEAEGKEIYLATAIERERLTIDEALLRRLATRYRLMIWTGRTRDEFDPVWGERLSSLFEKICCMDDFPGLPPKPAPDMLTALLRENGIVGGWYIGNSVDDMRAAIAAGIGAIGVETTLNSEQLRAAGAQCTVSSIAQIAEVFQT